MKIMILLATIAALLCGADVCELSKREAQKACRNLPGEARHACTLAVKACEVK